LQEAVEADLNTDKQQVAVLADLLDCRLSLYLIQLIQSPLDQEEQLLQRRMALTEATVQTVLSVLLLQ
jgi:hypothetical protein